MMTVQTNLYQIHYITLNILLCYEQFSFRNERQKRRHYINDFSYDTLL